jgi:hypothetical protein
MISGIQSIFGNMRAVGVTPIPSQKQEFREGHSGPPVLHKPLKFTMQLRTVKYR